MNIEQVRDFTLSLLGVTEDQPFGDDNITFRVEGKIFLCLWLGGDKFAMNDSMLRFACKLSPERNEELREQYSAITPAFHWNKTHWSDVFFEQLEYDFVISIIKESYEVIVNKLPKSVRVKYQSRQMNQKFVETIKIKNGIALNLPYHQARMERTIQGTKRAYLLDNGLIKEAFITVDDLMKAKGIRLFNAMIEFGEIEVEAERVKR